MVTRYRLLAAGAACSVLAGCGAGGGRIASTPPPAPTPTPTPNSSLADLHDDQTFDTNSATATAVFDTSTGTVTSGNSAPSGINVTYDANSKSYTISTTGRNQTFAPADVQPGSLPGETRYAITNGSTRDYLTLVVTPYTSTTSNKYVGLGYWQRNDLNGSTQTTTFDSFVYGFETPTAAIPRVGSANYAIDAFGLVTTPGKEPKALSGSGAFQVDLLEGLFQTKAYVSEYSLTSDSFGAGGTILLQGAGHLSSGNGFSGDFSYSGFDGTVGGSMAGNFFGPNAQEIGASFSARNNDGAAVTGSLTGQLDTNQPPVTLALTNIVADTTLPERFAEFTAGTDTSLTPAFRGSIGYDETEGGNVIRHVDGSVSVTLAASTSTETTFTDADRAAIQKSNFDSYDVVQGAGPLDVAGPVHLDLYKPGNSNQELALTYTSFGIWTKPYQNGTYSQVSKDFFVYGLETPQGLLAYRTGTGTYNGVVYGATTTSSGVLEDVGGTSQFDVNFGNQTYTGSLNLTAATAGAAPTSLGTWTFGDTLTNGQMNETALLKNGVGGVSGLEYNSISPRFYGPDGEEIGATFSIQNGYPGDVGTTAITGVTVAKRR